MSSKAARGSAVLRTYHDPSIVRRNEFGERSWCTAGDFGDGGAHPFLRASSDEAFGVGEDVGY